MSGLMCPVCGEREIRTALGQPQASVLFVLDYPNWETIREHAFLNSKEHEILHKECSRAGLSLGSCRIVYTFGHELPERPKNPDLLLMWETMQRQELSYWESHLINELKPKYKAIVWFGETLTRILPDADLKAYGLPVAASLWWGSDTYATVCPAPYLFKSKPVGELRLVLSKVAEVYR